MRHHQVQFLLTPCLLIILVVATKVQAKSVIEPCNGSDSCNSLLSYLLPYDSKLSEIAYRFRVNFSDILAANSIDPISPSLGDQILEAKSLIRVPISCPCIDGIRRSVSTTYNVMPADTVDSIAEGFGGLASGQQVRSINGVSARNPLTSGQSLVIPLPCTCFNNSYNGFTSLYMSYVVQTGQSLSSLSAEFGATVAELQAVSGLGQPVVDPGDILAIPIPACSSSSANLKWYKESLIVPNGSYALTASSCIKCTCGPSDLNLRCGISGVGVSCSRLQCKGSDLLIGDEYVKESPNGCNITACVYRGHNGGKIFSSLLNSSLVPCTGDTSNNAMSPRPSSSSNPTFPFITLPPSSSSSPSPSYSMGINGSDSTIKRNSTTPRGKGVILSLAIFFFVFPLELAVYLNF